MYGVIGSTTRKIKKVYGAISATTRNIKKIYGVVGGVTKLIFSSGLGTIIGATVWLYNSYNNYVFALFGISNNVMSTSPQIFTTNTFITGISGDGKTVVQVSHGNFINNRGVKVYRYNSSTKQMDLSFETTDTFSSTFASSMTGKKCIIVNYDGTMFMLCGRYNNGSYIRCEKYSIGISNVSYTGTVVPLDPLDAGLPGFESGEYSLYDNFVIFASDDLSSMACGSYFNTGGTSYIYCGGYITDGESNNYFSYNGGNYGPYLTPDGKYLIRSTKSSTYSATNTVYYNNGSSLTSLGTFTISSSAAGYTYNRELEILSFYYTSGNITSYKLSSSSVTQIGTCSSGYNNFIVRCQSFSGKDMIFTGDDDSQSRRIRHASVSLGENGNISSISLKATYSGSNSFYAKADSPIRYMTGSAAFIHE